MSPIENLSKADKITHHYGLDEMPLYLCSVNINLTALKLLPRYEVIRQSPGLEIQRKEDIFHFIKISAKKQISERKGEIGEII